MLIDASFPGGNVQILKVDDGHVHFGPDHRDSLSGWFYWCFGVRQAAGQTLVFHPCRKNLMTSHAPAVSVDGGRSWAWADRACVKEDDSFTLTIPDGVDDWRVSMAIPYTQEHLAAFTQQHVGRWATDTLCLTSLGSEVPLWRIGPDAQQAAHRVMITARHHSCESMASYMLEGVIEAALGEDELGRWWQQHVSLTAVPFVDWDGVVKGDQGKNRHPHDHNRDYVEQSIYPQTPAIQREVRLLAALGLGAALDLHCPWIRGPGNEKIYMVGHDSDYHWAQQEVLATHLAKAATGPLPFDPKDNLPFGQSWNTAVNYAGGCSFARWTSEQAGVGVCTTMEIPYALSHGHVMTADNVRLFGSQMAQALRTYLESSPRNAR